MKRMNWPCHAAAAAVAATALGGCALEPRYIAGDPVHEKIRAQKYPQCDPFHYPFDAQANEQQGVVTLDVLVDEQGKVVSAEVAQSSGFKSLDYETLSGVRRCRFEPLTEEGHPIRYKTKFVFHWELWVG